jgi:hypothetical protein
MSFPHIFKNLYFATLPFIVPSGIVNSYCLGLNYNFLSKESSHIKQIVNIVGITYIGTIITIMYPISFPILGLFYFIK